MRAAVVLPAGEDMNEWLAVHSMESTPFARVVCHPNIIIYDVSCTAVDFYNEVSLLYGTINDFCTPESCPTMSAGAE